MEAFLAALAFRIATNGTGVQRLHVWLNHNESVGIWVTAVATVLLVVGIWVARAALRDQRTTRYAELILEFARQWDSPEISESFELGRMYQPNEGLIALADKAMVKAPAQEMTDHVPVGGAVLARGWWRPRLARRICRTLGVSFPEPEVNADDELSRRRQNHRDWMTVSKWPNFLDTIGVVVYHRALPTDMVYGIWGGAIIDAWSDWKDTVRHHRAQFGDENIWRYFEWLVSEMDRQGARAERLRLDRKGPVGAAILGVASRPEAAAGVDNRDES